MALTVETGAGVSGAASYASVATIDAYWTARAHHALSATWGAASTGDKEGAAREASAYLDATFGPYYRGRKRGEVQGLLWPRTDALDDAGYPLPDLPNCVVSATAELAVRALAATLAEDQDRGGAIRRVAAGSVEVEYAEGAPIEKRYGMVTGMLAPVLDGRQPGAPMAAWSWR